MERVPHLRLLVFYLPWQCTAFAIQQSLIQDEVTVPWDLLDTAALRRKLLVNPESFSHVKTLDPMRMTPRDVYDVLDLLLKGQTSGVQPLEFSIRDNFDSNGNLHDDDISELPDPPSPPKQRTASPENPGNAADLPFGSPPPSSESMIEIAIQNVARAGYLSIIPHATATKVDQTPSQQSVIVKTTSSRSKKRMEMEQEENSGKQTKKRAKITVTVPAREQSLRYDV